jgi:succinyl-diaminopimelate desuccinylase
MKGAIAAFVAACADVPDHGGTLSLIITGDEEGPAIHGTQALMVWMEERGIRPDMILIGSRRRKRGWATWSRSAGAAP